MNDAPARLRFAQVQVRYPGGHELEFDFAVEPGEFFGVLGASGSGKTTAIKIAAGLIRSRGATRAQIGLPLDATHDGSFLIDDVDASGWEPARRQLGLISQHSNLYPHLTVRQNLEIVATGGLSTTELQKLADELNIGHTLDRKPHEISGGENQRVALAKAMINRARSILADEPFSGLDGFRRLDLTDLLREFHRRHQRTTLFVSHDQETLLALAQRVAFLHEGRILQIDTPARILHEPNHIEVAQALDPGFRCRRPVQLEARSFLFDGLRLDGPALPSQTHSVVLNTRTARVQCAGENNGDGWSCRTLQHRREFFGGQAVWRHRFNHDSADWRIPDGPADNADRASLYFPRPGVLCFDATGRRIYP